MTAAKIAELNAALDSGEPLTTEQLAWHLQVDPKHAPGMVGAFGLEPEGRLYPWRRIWRHVHRTEGAGLAGHLALLKARHPGSAALAEVDDLEAALRAPLIGFAAMAGRRGLKADTQSKALREGRAALPFPQIGLGPRTRRFRLLEVRLWVEEEIRLALPAPPGWAILPAASTDPAGAGAAATSVDPAAQAVFGGFAAFGRTAPT